MFAADQLHRVKRSIHAELTPAVQSQVVENEVEARFPLDVVRYHAVSAAAGLAVFRQYLERKSTRLNSSHIQKSRMPSSA